MGLRAEFTRSYLRRYLLMSAIGLGWAGWCIYDGAIAYPKKYELASAYQAFSKMEKVERDDAWKKLAREKGWAITAPKTAEEIRGSILQQYVMAGLGLLIGIPALCYYISSRGAWVERTENGLATSWGQTVDFSTVEKLNKRKWRHKGIARCEYRDGGTRRVFVFDDFKYDRKPLGRILVELESVLRDDQIVEGQREGTPEPEPPPAAASTEE